MNESVPPVKILGFVGARGGSKGLPRKNIKEFDGKPLIYWTLDALKSSPYITDVVLSTDDAEIAEISRALGFDVPFLRPPELADDEAEIVDVMFHAIHWLKEHCDQTYDYILLAHPTVPLRSVAYVNDALERYFKHRRHDDDTMVSVCKVLKKYGWLTHCNDEGYLTLSLGSQSEIPLQRQKLKQYYLPNGAMWLFPMHVLSKDFYGPKTQFYVMPEEVSVDIDTQEDFDKAVALREKYPEGFPVLKD